MSLLKPLFAKALTFDSGKNEMVVQKRFIFI